MEQTPSRVSLSISREDPTADFSESTLRILVRSLKLTPEQILERLDEGALMVPRVRVSDGLIELLKALKSEGFGVRTFAAGWQSHPAEPEESDLLQGPDGTSEDEDDEDGETEWHKGDVIGGLYEVLGESSGGMGRVYFVFHRLWKMMLAIKTPLPGAVKTDSHLLRFLREAEFWVNLGLHPNIATCYYARVINRLPRLFIEYVDGGSLDEWIFDKRFKDLGAIIDLMIQFCHGMIHAEKKGMVHRDIKPANVLMTRDGIPKVTDFGLVKRIDNGDASPGLQADGADEIKLGDADLTVLEGGVRGSPRYMAPERFAGRSPVDIRSDIYSFGIMLYEILLDRMPFAFPAGYSLRELVRSHLHVKPMDPRNISGDIPRGMVRIIMTSLEKEPHNRYASFVEVCQALERLSMKLNPDRAVRERPNLVAMKADSLNNQAVSLLDLGREAEAMRLFEDALSANPEHLQTFYNFHARGWALGQVSDQDVVARMESLKIEARETADYRHLLGLIRLQRGDPKRAVTLLAEAGADSPQYRGRWQDYGGDPGAFVDSLNLTAIEGLGHFPGHLKGIRALAISSTRGRAFSVAEDRTIRVWDLESLRCLKNLRTFTFIPIAGAFSRDGKLAATAYGQAFKTVDLWDLQRVGHVRQYRGLAINMLCFSPDSRVLAGLGPGNVVRLWDTDSEEVVGEWDRFPDEINCLSLLDGAKSAILAGVNGSLTRFDVESGETAWHVKRHRGPVQCLAMSDDGRVILSGGADQTVRLVDASNGKEHARLTGHRKNLVAVYFLPHSDYILSASEDRAIKIWDIATGRCCRTITVPDEELTNIAVSGDGKRLVSGGVRGSLHLWSLDTGWFEHDFLEPAIARPRTFKELSKLHASFKKEIESFDVAWKSSDRTNAVKTFKKIRSAPGFSWSREAIVVRNQLCEAFSDAALEYSSFIRALGGHESAVVSVAGTEDGLMLLSGSLDGTAALWDVVSGRCVNRFSIGSPVRRVFFLSAGQGILTWSEDCVLRRWSLAGKLLMQVEEVFLPVSEVSDDSRIIALDPDNRPVEIDLEQGRQTSAGQAIPGRDFQCFSPGSKAVYSLRDSTRIQRWETATGLTERTFRALGVAITSMKPFPSDDRFVAGLENGELTVYMVGSGINVVTVKGHSGPVHALDVGPRPTFWVSGGDDATLRVWDLEKEACMAVLEGHATPVRSVCFFLNGSMIASGSSEGVVRLWGLEWDLSQASKKLTGKRPRPPSSTRH